MKFIICCTAFEEAVNYGYIRYNDDMIYAVTDDTGVALYNIKYCPFCGLPMIVTR